MLNDSLQKVVQNGYCVGCGACRVASGGVIAFKRDVAQRTVPILSEGVGLESVQDLGSVCPFSESAANEDQIGAALFGTAAYHDKRVGWYRSIGAGRIVGDESLMLSSSGGLTSWVLGELLSTGAIDGVVHVGPNEAPQGENLFSFQVSHTADEILTKRKSQYYSADFADALLSIRGNGKRYALVGVPCYIKALRLLQQADSVLKSQFILAIALVCGHMKTPAFAQALAWQLGILPNELRGADFRVKDLGAQADEYSFAAWSDKNRSPRQRPMQSLLGHNWGHALFQLKACDFCDDVFGETADACFGDAWLPQYIAEPRGTNVVINRSEIIETLLHDGAKQRRIVFEKIDLNDLVTSQAGNFRHRREGLGVRIQDSQRRGEWFPPKRLQLTKSVVPQHRKLLVRVRRALAARSHEAFVEAKRRRDFGYFAAQTWRYRFAMKIVYRLQRMLDWR